MFYGANKKENSKDAKCRAYRVMWEKGCSHNRFKSRPEGEKLMNNEPILLPCNRKKSGTKKNKKTGNKLIAFL